MWRQHWHSAPLQSQLHVPVTVSTLSQLTDSLLVQQQLCVVVVICIDCKTDQTFPTRLEYHQQTVQTDSFTEGSHSNTIFHYSVMVLATGSPSSIDLNISDPSRDFTRRVETDLQYIVQASYEHRADIIKCRYAACSRSTSSLVYHHSSRWSDRDKDAVNRCSTCEDGEPEAAVVVGCDEMRLSGCCHRLGSSK